MLFSSTSTTGNKTTKMYCVLSILCICIFSITVDAKALCQSQADCATRSAKETFTQLIRELRAPIQQDATEAVLPYYKYKLFNLKMDGHKNCVIQNVKHNSVNIKFDMTCPHIAIHAYYLPKGGSKEDVNIMYDTLHIEVNGGLKTFTKDGKQYININDFNLTLDPRRKIKYNISNLFKIETEKGTGFLKYIGQNWNDVTVDMDHPIFKIFVKELVKNMNNYLDVVPVDDLNFD